MKVFVSTLAFLILSLPLLAQEFALITDNFDPFEDGGADWGDFDADGDLDLIMNGYDPNTDLELAILYTNNGNGTFTALTLGNSGGDGVVRFMDINNDGYLEIVDHNYIQPRIYFFNPDDASWEGSDLNTLNPNDYVQLLTEDLYRDGLDELIATGESFQILFNGSVENSIGLSLNEVGRSIIEDFDRDGDLDVLVSQEGGILLNNIGTAFTLDTLNLLTDFGMTELISAASGYLNDDPFIDIAFSSFDQIGLYVSDGELSYQKIPITTNMQGAFSMSIQDMDLNGFPELIISGYAVDSDDSEVFLTEIHEYRDGLLSLINVFLSGGKHNLVDVDNDGDLDFFGYFYDQPTLLENVSGTINAPPSLTAGVEHSINGTQLTIQWEASVDDHTPANAIGYHVWIYNADGDYVTNPKADFNGNFHQHHSGNARNNLFYSIDLDAGTYYYSVQALDASGSGSGFSDPVMVTLSNPYEPLTNFPITSGIETITTIVQSLRGSMDLADFDGDGSLDLAVAGEIGGFSTVNVYHNDGEGVFSDAGIAIRPLRNAEVKWIDFDNNGWMDLFIMGVDTAFENPVPTSRLYKNYGSGTLIEFFSFPIGTNRSDFGDLQDWGNNECIDSDWSDIDGDGDLDALISGYNSKGARETRLYQNNQSGFSLRPIEQARAVLPVAGGVQWLDADNDGNLDFLSAGVDSDDNLLISLLQFQNGYFKLDTIAYTPWFDTSFFNAKIALLDFDLDRDFDFLISSEYNWIFEDETDTLLLTNSILLAFQNDNGSFHRKGIFNTPLTTTNNNIRSVQLIDINDDHLKDVITTGNGVSFAWTNQGNGNFGFQRLFNGLDDYVIAGNLDADPALEVLAKSDLSGNIGIVEVNRSKATSLEEEVTDFSAVVSGNAVLLSWSEMDSTLEYNLYLRNVTSRKTIRSNYNRNGQLTTVRPELLLTNFLEFDNLPDGAYEWGVQLVDAGLNTSHVYPGTPFEIRQFQPLRTDTLGTCEYCVFADHEFVKLTEEGEFSLMVAQYDEFAEKQVLTTLIIDPLTGVIDTLPISGLSQFEFSDANGDGLLDFFGLSGEIIELDGYSFYQPNRISLFMNQGNRSFLETSIIHEFGEDTDMIEPAIELGDIDNDGFPDLAFSTNLGIQIMKGSVNGYQFHQLLENYGHPEFVDINQDGYLDLFVNGYQVTYYLNDGTYFAPSGFNLIGSTSDQLWLDYDLDGDLDLILSTGLFVGITTKFFTNDGSGNLAQDNAVELEGNFAGAHLLDYDNDGTTELLFDNVESFDYSFPIKIFSNSTGQYQNINIQSIPEWTNAISIPSDFNQDGTMDLFFLGTGYNSFFEGALLKAIYEGQSDRFNEAPAPPSTVEIDITNFRVEITWDDALDDLTPKQHLRYHVFLEREENGIRQSIIHQDLDNQGGQLLWQRANAGFNNIFLIDSLPDGTYYCRVQTIDINGKRSTMSEEEAFEVFVGPELSEDRAPGVTCSNSTVTYVAQPADYDYEWEIEGGKIESSPENNIVIVQWDTIGPGMVSVTNLLFPLRQDSLLLDILEAPAASFTYGDKLATNTLIPFRNLSSGDITEYLWTFGNGTTSIEQSPVHSVSSSSSDYQVNLRVTSSNGCSDQSSASLDIGDERELNITALVTPNNDNYNDYLFIEFLERYEGVHVRVFNTAGQLVYENSNYSPDVLWDFEGKGGSPLPAGNYLVYVNIPNSGLSAKQTVTLMR